MTTTPNEGRGGTGPAKDSASPPSRTSRWDRSHNHDQKISQPEHHLTLVESFEADSTDLSPGMTAMKRAVPDAERLRIQPANDGMTSSEGVVVVVVVGTGSGPVSDTTKVCVAPAFNPTPTHQASERQKAPSSRSPVPPEVGFGRLDQVSPFHT